jgi:hypothetical protein
LAGILTQLALYSVNLRIMGKSMLAVSVDKFDLLVSVRNQEQSCLVALLFVAAIIGVLYWFFGTELGCAIRATGANGNMSRAQGINTEANKMSNTPLFQPLHPTQLYESAAELLESIGQTERGLDALARAGFHTLRLQTYLTAGPKESRAWTIHRGDTAPKAAGVIHTDFEKGFIKAEIVSFEDLVAAGSMAAAKSAGKVRIEGKDYVMVDGDVVEFRFNV